MQQVNISRKSWARLPRPHQPESSRRHRQPSSGGRGPVKQVRPIPHQLGAEVEAERAGAAGGGRVWVERPGVASAWFSSRPPNRPIIVINQAIRSRG
jgi:hypothetical protein